MAFQSGFPHQTIPKNRQFYPQKSDFMMLGLLIKQFITRALPNWASVNS